MNINEDYGIVGDMPSQIADSIEYEDNYKGFEYQSHLIHDVSADQQKQPNLDQSIQDDSFLQNIEKMIKPKTQIKKHIKQNNLITFSKQQISKVALSQQDIRQQITIVSISQEIILIKILQSNLNAGFHGKFQIKQLYLEPYASVELGIAIQKKTKQYGDIYDTLILQYNVVTSKNDDYGIPQKKYIPIEIKFVRPKLKLNYLGCSDIINIIGNNKVSLNRVTKNKSNQYQIEVGMNSGVLNMQLDRIQCNISTMGNLHTFPKELIFYGGQYRSISIRSKDKDKKGFGVIIIKSQNAKVNFIIGIQLI